MAWSHFYASNVTRYTGDSTQHFEVYLSTEQNYKDLEMIDIALGSVVRFDDPGLLKLKIDMTQEVMEIPIIRWIPQKLSFIYIIIYVNAGNSFFMNDAYHVMSHQSKFDIGPRSTSMAISWIEDMSHFILSQRNEAVNALGRRDDRLYGRPQQGHRHQHDFPIIRTQEDFYHWTCALTDDVMAISIRSTRMRYSKKKYSSCKFIKDQGLLIN
jgi:hypothetical protein